MTKHEEPPMFSTKAKFFFLLVTMPVLLFRDLQGQNQEMIDSLILLVNDEKVPDDTNKVKSLYGLVKLVTDYGYQARLKVMISTNGRDLSYMALKISSSIHYERGIDEYIKSMDYVSHQKMFTPYIEFQSRYFYKEMMPDNLKDIYQSSEQKHGGSLYNGFVIRDHYKEFGLEERIYLAQYRIGLCYYDWRNYKKARDYLKNAFDQACQVNDSNTIPDILLDLGMTYFRMNKPDSARYMFDKALLVTRRRADDKKTLAALNNAGETFYADGKYAEALEYFVQSRKVAGYINDTVFIAKTWLKTGHAYSKLNQYDKALQNLSYSLSLARLLNDKRTERDIYFALFGIYSGKGEDQKALYCNERYHLLRDSLFEADVSAYVALQDTYWQTLVSKEISRKEREAIDERQTSLQLNKTRFYTMALSAGILISLLFIYLIYRSYVTKKRSNAYLMRLNHERNKLISVISHDLRGPLAGFMNILLHIRQNAATLSRDSIEESIIKVYTHAGIIKKLLDNLLEWAKLQRGDIKPNLEALSAKALLDKNVLLYQSLAAGKNISLQNNVRSDIIIKADVYMMDTVIRNLLDNAIKYTNPGGKISIEERFADRIVEISVIDDGIGITKEQLSTLFAATGNGNRMEFRSGLGLLLCKEYIEKCGGTISAKSQGEGKGSTFFLTLPVEVHQNAIINTDDHL